MRYICIVSVIIILNFTVFGQNTDNCIKYVELAPKYNELHSYFKESLTYPEYAYKNKISGTVWVSFTVDANKWVKNHVTNVHVVQSIHPSIDFAAISVAMSIPNIWDPPSRGMYDTVRFVFPIEFNLETVELDKVSDCFEQRIKELLILDTMTLDSILYKDKPVKKELYIGSELIENSEKKEKKPSSEYIKIKGTVKAFPENCPLPMVQVYEIGTNNATLTDVNGEFSLFINIDSEVKFSCQGYDYYIQKFSKASTDLEIYLSIYHEEMFTSPAYIPKWRRIFKFRR